MVCYLAGHDELARDLARHLARAQQLGRLQRGAVRGDDLAPGRQLQRLARAQAGLLQPDSLLALLFSGDRGVY